MKTRVEVGKELTLTDNINPNFSCIKKYYPELNEDRFYNHYQYHKNKHDFKSIKALINKNKLASVESDLLYFVVEYGQSLEMTDWFREVNIQKVHHDEHKQKIELKQFLSKIISLNSGLKLSHKEVVKLPAVAEIVIHTDKQLSIKMDSYPLCYDIINLLIEKYSEPTAPLKQRNLNPKQYKKDFVLRLKPFIKYLNNETKGFGSLNKIYSFVADFINLLNPNINLDSEIIKDTLKPSKSRGKTTHKNS